MQEFHKEKGLKESEGLEFKNNLFGGDCRVVGIGSCTDTVIVIPKMHKGRPVTAIGEEAFRGKGRGASIIMQEGITKICDSAFYNSDVVSVTIPVSVKKIGDNAFLDTYQLREVKYNGSRSDWEKIEKSHHLSFGSYDRRVAVTFLK